MKLHHCVVRGGERQRREEENLTFEISDLRRRGRSEEKEHGLAKPRPWHGTARKKNPSADAEGFEEFGLLARHTARKSGATKLT
jgi:hypothetical protein